MIIGWVEWLSVTLSKFSQSNSAISWEVLKRLNHGLIGEFCIQIFIKHVWLLDAWQESILISETPAFKVHAIGFLETDGENIRVSLSLSLESFLRPITLEAAVSELRASYIGFGKLDLNSNLSISSHIVSDRSDIGIIEV